MLFLLVFYLHSLLPPALGQTIPEADHPNFIPDSEGDLFFLLDSSGSVTYDEFAKVKKFIGDLLQPFKFSPQDVQASVVQISTNPTLEFPLNQYTSSKDITKAIQDIRQRMGDTNTGKAIEYVKKNLYAQDFGSRADVPKVLVWVTDGLSTDDISGPMKLLKDMGVSVFIISTTGRGNYRELSAAASEPDEKYLKFVDKDDLGIITKELRDSIIELIQAKRLHAVNITTTSFQLTWPRLLSKDIGHYILEYSPVADPGKKLQHSLHGDQTSFEITGLTANTAYKVTLFPESNIDYFQPQSIEVSTLQEVKEERNLEAQDITTTSFWLTWTRLSGDTGVYVVEYSPVTDPRRKLQKTSSEEETSVVLSDLTPNTTYQVTLIPDSNDPNIQPETIQVSTLPDYIQARHFQILDITSTSFNATWSKLIGDTGRYFLDYALQSYPRRKTRKMLYGDQTSVVVSGLTPDTGYQVTFVPESKLEDSQSQTLPVWTLPDMIQARNLQVHDVTSKSLHLSWSKLEGDTGHYAVNYGIASQPHVTSKMSLYDERRMVIGNLRPNTTYQITFIPESNMQYIQVQTITVTTLPDQALTRNLQALNITRSSFVLTWSRLPGDEGQYILEYAPISEAAKIQQRIVFGDETRAVVSGLRPGITYQVTLILGDYAVPEVITVSTESDQAITRNLQALNITRSSFVLTWSRLPGDEGNYILEYAPISEAAKIQQRIVFGDETRVVVSGLRPGTTYQVTLIPGDYAVPEVITVSTESDQALTRNLQALNITRSSFILTWSRLPGDEGYYILKYVPVSEAAKIQQRIVFGDETRAVVSGLRPGTTYQVTLIPGDNSVPEVIMVSTESDQALTRNLQALNITRSSFVLTWSRLPGDEGQYILEYAPISEAAKIQQRIVFGDETRAVVSGLRPGTTYQVTLIPGDYTVPEVITVSTESDQALTRNLQALHITRSSFVLTWSRLPGDEGNYILEYAPISEAAKIQQRIVFGDETRAVVSGLRPGTTYQVTLIPGDYTVPEVITVSTESDQAITRNLQALNITRSSFVLTWSRLPGDEGNYILEYAPISEAAKIQQRIVFGDETRAVVSGLRPGTTYQVTLIPGDYTVPEVITVSTESDQAITRNLQALNITRSSFVLTWSRLPGDEGYYILKYVPVSEAAKIQQRIVFGDETRAVVSGLRPGTTYQVTLIPGDNSVPEVIMISTESDQALTRNLQALNITRSSFVLTWSRFPGDEGNYILEYAPISEAAKIQQRIVFGDETRAVVSGLRPGTTYQVTLIPGDYAVPEVITVSTQKEPVWQRHFQAINITATGFLLTWSRAPDDGGNYIVEYSPVSDPGGRVQKILTGDVNSMMFSDLPSNTTYQVSLFHESGVRYGTIQVSTLIDPLKARNLHVQDRTSESFQLSWSKLPGDTGRYVLRYAPLADLSKTIQNILYGDLTSMMFNNLIPDTVYQVTFIPDSKGQFNQEQIIMVSTLPEPEQKRAIYARDMTTSSLQLAWSRMPGDKGPYIVEFVLVSNPRRKLRKILPNDQTNMIFSNLSPNTEYRATVFSESNIHFVPPQSIEVSTLEDELSPSHILISDPSPHSFRVSWGPRFDSVAGYEIQYGPVSGNIVQTLQVDSKVNSTVLENLKSNTTYLVTVSSIFKSGGEKALSAIACTIHNDTKVRYLHLKDQGSNNVKVTWGSADGEVQGYRVRCRRQAGRSSVTSVAAQTHSIYLTDMADGTMNKICVMPIYKNGNGKNLCRKIQMQPGTSANIYSSR